MTDLLQSAFAAIAFMGIIWLAVHIAMPDLNHKSKSFNNEENHY